MATRITAIFPDSEAEEIKKLANEIGIDASTFVRRGAWMMIQTCRNAPEGGKIEVVFPNDPERASIGLVNESIMLVPISSEES